MQNKEHKLVNWVNGMGINATHLEQTENYFIEAICDSNAIRLTKTSYGLLPSPDKQTDSTEFDISEQVTGQVEIKLRRCNALTQGGYRISYNPQPSDFMLYTHSFKEDNKGKSAHSELWDVIITADPYRRVPEGVPDEESNPPRHPDAAAHIRLSVLAKGELNAEELGLFHLIIGRVRHKGGRYEVDTNFIPPCVNMLGHSDLAKYYKLFGDLLNDIERTSKVIISKVRNRSQNSPIALHIANVCEDMMRYIASIFFSYRNTGVESPPVEVVNYFSTLAHTCYASLNFISKAEKEELLRYFYEWSDVTPGSFEDLLADTLGIVYDHNNIRSVMLQVESFLQVMAELWIKLSTLEYIGQHKDNIVISERHSQTEQPKSKGGWTILD